MTATIADANDTIRHAVESRLEAQAAGKPQSEWYGDTKPMPECATAEVSQQSPRGWSAADVIERFAAPETRTFYGAAVHPTSQAFFDLCDQLKEMHRRKSSDYGCPSGTDPLANIRNGAKFVGIEPWRAAMVRLSDKVTRLASYCATGRLENETLEDSLADLASYSLLALLLHREEHAQ